LLERCLVQSAIVQLVPGETIGALTLEATAIMLPAKTPGEVVIDGQA